ncbi:hypothetical protein FOPE_06598 [Fonsecaea pedrosoi]|nr:hypothetical protein FOPE_06598 [Fonsecaea pedrosoi]
MEMESTPVEIPTSNSLFQHRNLDARLLPILRDLAPLLLRLARVRLNGGSGSAVADHTGAVAQKSSLLQAVKF